VSARRAKPANARAWSSARETEAKPARGSSRAARELGAYERLWRAAAGIPRGRVVSYGQLAELAGLPRAARQAGYAMAALPSGTRIPWQRVVNARGELSARSDPGGELVQRALLEREGVVFDARGRIDLVRFGWRPRATSLQRLRSGRARAR
jgi:methylated-DNA-protein-cysteine methyltransferase-like protein